MTKLTAYEHLMEAKAHVHAASCSNELRIGGGSKINADAIRDPGKRERRLVILAMLHAACEMLWEAADALDPLHHEQSGRVSDRPEPRLPELVAKPGRCDGKRARLVCLPGGRGTPPPAA